MRILAIQFVPDTRGRSVPRFEPQLGTLLALLRKRGHDLDLLGLSRFDLEATKAALARSLPQLIYADIAGVCVDAARRTLEYIQQHEFLPIVTGGNFPTVDPAASLSLPGVQAAAIGEPDASLVTYFERVKDPVAGQVVLGVWLRDETGLARPGLPHLVEDLNSLPFPERDLFGYAEYVRQTGQVEIAIGRGCPQQCAYCINDWLENIYDDRGTWVRRRSPENVAAEINLLRGHYEGVRTVRFLDHTFALDAAWLARFVGVYSRRCQLPFCCHLRLNAVDDEIVDQLKQAGCELVDVELISGSDFVRNEIFDMDLDGEQIDTAFARLKRGGLRTRAIVYVGAPYESAASIEETRALVLKLRPDLLDVRPYYPFPGTRAQELARDNGWLHRRGEEEYHRDRSGLDLPSCRPAEVVAFIRRLRSDTPVSVGAPWWRRWSHASRTAFSQLLHKRR